MWRVLWNKEGLRNEQRPSRYKSSPLFNYHLRRRNNLFSKSCTVIADSSLFSVELSGITFCLILSTHVFVHMEKTGLDTFCCNSKLFTLFCFGYFQKYNNQEIPKIRVFLSFTSSIDWVFKTGKAITLELSSEDCINSLREVKVNSKDQH